MSLGSQNRVAHQRAPAFFAEPEISGFFAAQDALPIAFISVNIDFTNLILYQVFGLVDSFFIFRFDCRIQLVKIEFPLLLRQSTLRQWLSISPIQSNLILTHISPFGVQHGKLCEDVFARINRDDFPCAVDKTHTDRSFHAGITICCCNLQFDIHHNCIPFWRKRPMGSFSTCVTLMAAR